MATRKEIFGALDSFGSGFSKMGTALMERERYDTQKALEEEEAERKRKLFSHQEAAAAAGAEEAKLKASEALATADKRKEADAANQALFAENAAAGWTVDPEDEGQVSTWKAELNALNRFRAKEGKPAMSVAEYVQAKKTDKFERTKATDAEKRAGEKHTSEMEIDKAQRRLLGAQADKAGAEARGEIGGGAKAGIVKAGETLVPGLKAMADVEITKDSVQKVKQQYAAYAEMKNQIAAYQNLYKELGTEAVGEGADKLEAMATGMQLTLKELQNLGVLNGPDLMLMQKQVPSAAGFGAKLKGAAYGMAGQDPIGPKLQELDKFIQNRFVEQARVNGFELESPPGGGEKPIAEKPAAAGIAQIKDDAEYDALPSGAEFIGPDGKRRRKP